MMTATERESACTHSSSRCQKEQKGMPNVRLYSKRESFLIKFFVNGFNGFVTCCRKMGVCVV